MKIMIINILGVNYEVEEVAIIDNDNNIMGKIIIHDQKIFLKKGLPQDTKNHTLLHEITHGLLFQLGEFEMYGNEHLVQRIATAYHQIIKDNEWLSIKKS